MKNEAVQFPDKFFDIISCRHAPFSASEVFRLLRSGGIFLCQNVTEEDKINIKQAFGRGQNYGLPDGKLLKKDVKKLNKAGFTQIKTDQYNAVVYYQAPKDLLFTLKNTPIIMDFGSKDTDLELFKKFIKENTTNKGIVTNSSRSLIVAKK